MEHRFDVVAVGIEGEGGVVAGMIGALAGPAIVASAMGERRRMKGVHTLPVPGLEGEVDAGDRAVGPVDPELVAGEMLRALRCEIAPEGLQDRAVKRRLASRSETRRWTWSIRRP